MKHNLPLAWRPLTSDGNILYLKYSFGPGTANSLATRLEDGSWAVISPPPKAPETVYATLEQQAQVSALIAPNAFHNLGQPAWRERFPLAISYAHAAAIERLKKQTPGVIYHRMDELLARLRRDTFILEPRGMKSPDLIFQLPAAGQLIWWAGDLFSNNSGSDQQWWFRQLARLLGSGLGYRCNARPELVYVSDRRAWIESVQAAIVKRPPTIVVPAHGDPVAERAVIQTRQALDIIKSR